jgi:hypothetical protein
VPKKHVEEVVRCFTRHLGPVEVVPAPSPVELPKNDDDEVVWAGTFEALRGLRRKKQIPAGEFIFALTASPNEYNYYTEHDRNGEPRNAFGHVADFDWVTTAPGWAITVHYLLITVIRVLGQESGLKDNLIAGHTVPRGCFGDFCADKRQLSFKLRTADICGDCLELFRRCGVPEELVRQIVEIQEAIRPLALATGPYQRDIRVFDEWSGRFLVVTGSSLCSPFSQAFTVVGGSAGSRATSNPISRHSRRRRVATERTPVAAVS